MDLDSLQRNWKKLNNSNAPVPDPQKCRSLSQRLRRRLRFTIIAGCTLPIFAVSMYRDLHLSLALCIIYGVLGVVLTAATVVIYRRLNDDRYLQLPMSEAACHIRRTIRLRENLRLMGIICAIYVVACMLYELYRLNIDAFLGACTGAVIGIGVGVAVDYRIRTELRQLLDSLTPDDGIE